MLPLILAALIVGAQPATPAPTHHIQIYALHKPSDQDLANVADTCAALASEQVSGQEVVDELNLDTQAKQQAFVDTCSVYFQGVEDGMAAAGQDTGDNEPHANPNASRN